MKQEQDSWRDGVCGCSIRLCGGGGFRELMGCIIKILRLFVFFCLYLIILII